MTEKKTSFGPAPRPGHTRHKMCRVATHRRRRQMRHRPPRAAPVPVRPRLSLLLGCAARRLDRRPKSSVARSSRASDVVGLKTPRHVVRSSAVHRLTPLRAHVRLKPPPPHWTRRPRAIRATIVSRRPRDPVPLRVPPCAPAFWSHVPAAFGRVCAPLHARCVVRCRATAPTRSHLMHRLCLAPTAPAVAARRAVATPRSAGAAANQHGARETLAPVYEAAGLGQIGPRK